MDFVSPLYNALQAQATLDHTRASTQDTQALAQMRQLGLVLQQQQAQRNQMMAEQLQKSPSFTNQTGPGAGNPPPAQPNLFGIDYDANDPLVESLSNAREGVNLTRQRINLAHDVGDVKEWSKATQDHDNQQKEYRLAQIDVMKESERRSREASQAFGSAETADDVKAALQYVNDNVSKKQARSIALQLAKTLPNLDNATPEQIQAAVDPIRNRYATMGEQLRFRGSMQASADRADSLEQRKTEATQRAARAQAGAPKEPDPQEVTAVGAQVATGVPLSQAVPGYGRWAQPLRDAARKEAINQIKQEEGVDDADAGRILAQRGIDYLAGRRSTTQLNTMRGATSQAVKQLDFNVDKVTEEMKKLPSTDISPVLNAMVRKVERWTGDPAYSSLYFYMHAAAMESARILQGGQASIAQLHQGAAEEAKKWADIGLTPAMWSEVSKAMHDEGVARLSTYDEAIKEQRVGKARGDTAPAAAGQKSATVPNASSKYQEGQTATGPGGKRLIFKGGQWQPM